MNLIRFGLMLFAVIGISLSSCKKEKNDTSEPDTSTLQQLSKDESDVQVATDDATSDVDGVISNGTDKSRWVPRNATLDSVAVVGDTITYTLSFNGLNSNSRLNRTGQIQIKKSVRTNWSMHGDKVFITFINYKVTKVSTNKSITLNGTKLFENASGGLIRRLGHGDSIVVHKISGALSLTFDDGSIRVWNIARKKTFTGTPGQILVSVDGFGVIGTSTNIEAWGTNRNGETFTSEIYQTVVIKEACQWDPVSGIIIHVITSRNAKAKITYGYDNNQPVTNNNCPTQYKLDWSRNGRSGTIYVQL